MPDVHSPEIRSKNMRAVRSANTRPEISIRKELHALGFRYRLNVRDLSGKPDLVFPKYKAVVFVHGCFWHLHGCRLFKWPEGNSGKWRAKLEGNALRDKRVVAELQSAGWRVLICWECALRGPGRLVEGEAARTIADWLHSGSGFGEISARETESI